MKNSKSVRFLASSIFVCVGALALSACTNGATVVDGVLRDDDIVCPTPNGIFDRSDGTGEGRCAPCQAGYFGGRLCSADSRTLSICSCFPYPVIQQDAGTNPQPATCEPTEVVYGTSCGVTCAASETTSSTCDRYGHWVDCRCVPRVPGGLGCAPNSVTYNSCGVTCANAGEVAGQICNGVGDRYGYCRCVPRQTTNPPPRSCSNNGEQRLCEGAFGCGTTNLVAREVCTGGIWSACQCVVGVTTRFCNNPGNPITPSASCVCAGGATGVQWCNNAGDGYTCVCPSNPGTETCSGTGLYTSSVCTARTTVCPSGQVWQRMCNGGVPGDCQCASTGGGSTGGGCGGGRVLAGARNGLQIRCWGTGRVFTSSGSQLDEALDGAQCGYTECVTGRLNSSGAFIEDDYYSNTANEGRPASDMFTAFGVTGRDSRLVDTLGSMTMRRDARNRIKAVGAVNTDCIGRGYSCGGT